MYLRILRDCRAFSSRSSTRPEFLETAWALFANLSPDFCRGYG